MATAIADRGIDSSPNRHLGQVHPRSSGWVELVAAARGVPEARREEGFQEVELEERHEDGAVWVIVAEEHHGVEEASLVAGEFQEAPPQRLEAVVLAEGEVRFQGGDTPCIAHGTRQMRPEAS